MTAGAQDGVDREALREVEILLASDNPARVRIGLELVRSELRRVPPGEARRLFEAVASLFYIDPLDRPDLVPVLHEAVSLVVAFGDWVIPLLLERLDANDIKAQIATAHALGRMGGNAVAPLCAGYAATSDPSRRAFILYALSKIRSLRVLAACPLALEAASSPENELRDTGTRALGKLAESIPASDLPRETRDAFVARLRHNLADADAAIRAKAVRSLGKLARHGHLPPEERDRLRGTLELLAGRDVSFDWDRAYIVRREAEEALRYL